MKTIRERLNEQDGLIDSYSDYSLPDMCQFCRHGRNADSMATGTREVHPEYHAHMKCHLLGCWVDEIGHCGSYRMF